MAVAEYAFQLTDHCKAFISFASAGLHYPKLCRRENLKQTQKEGPEWIQASFSSKGYDRPVRLWFERPIRRAAQGKDEQLHARDENDKRDKDLAYNSLAIARSEMASGGKVVIR